MGVSPGFCGFSPLRPGEEKTAVRESVRPPGSSSGPHRGLSNPHTPELQGLTWLGSCSQEGPSSWPIPIPESWGDRAERSKERSGTWREQTDKILDRVELTWLLGFSTPSIAWGRDEQVRDLITLISEPAPENQLQAPSFYSRTPAVPSLPCPKPFCAAAPVWGTTQVNWMMLKWKWPPGSSTLPHLFLPSLHISLHSAWLDSNVGR